MEVKPTFFSISGFLAPGVVLLASVTLLTVGHHFSSSKELFATLPSLPETSGLAVLVGTAIAVVLLTFAFVLGAVLSDVFIFVGRKLILRPLTRKMLQANVDRVFKHKTLDALIKADMDARESYVYMHTCGIDLHWYAGRIRMMGGTGLALLLAGIYSLVLCYSWGLVTGIIVLAFLAIGVSLYRSYKFDQYISAASAVLAQGGGLNERKEEA
jgi:hypothetical protein